jgi:hypothetical protein
VGLRVPVVHPFHDPTVKALDVDVSTTFALTLSDAGLKAVNERAGIGESEQTRRAIRAWLESKDVQ